MNKDNNNKPKFTYEELSQKYLEGKKEESEHFVTKDFAKDYSMIISFFFTLVLLITVGVFLGAYLDRKLNTKFLFILIFTFLGIAAAYRNLFKDVNKNNKGSSKK